MKSKKLGRIIISNALMEEEDLKFLLKLTSNVFPIHIEWFPQHQYYVYTCISDKFTEITEAEEIPFYNASVRQTKDNRLYLTLTK